MPFDSINKPLSNVEVWIKAIQDHPNFNMQMYANTKHMDKDQEMCAACIAREDATLKARGLKLPDSWSPNSWYRDIATPLAKFMGMDASDIMDITYVEVVTRVGRCADDIDTNKEYVINRIREAAIKSNGRTPNSPGPYYGDGTHRGDQGYAYSIYFGERHYEWLANTANRRGVSRARVIKELIDQAMQWDEALATTIDNYLTSKPREQGNVEGARKS